MLKSIRIKGYKSIRELEIKLNPINILIGANGVGKSNFISFFKLVNNIYEQRLESHSLKSGADNLLYYGRKNTKQISGYLNFGSNSYSFELEPTEKDSLIIHREDSIYPQNHNNPTFFDLNVKESNIKNSDTRRNSYLREHLESYKIYHFHDTGSSAPLRLSCNINENRILKEDGGNLPAYLYYLQQKHPLTFKRIEKVVQSVVPFFERFNLAPDLLSENSEKIKLEWNEKNHPEAYFNATHLSDGSLRFIALTTLLMQPNLPKIIIIDEPELGLHPTSIARLSGLIRSASDRGCQIIISTQSVNLVDNFEPKDIITVDKEGDQSVFRKLDENNLEEWLNDYSLGDLWEKSVIKGQPVRS